MADNAVIPGDSAVQEYTEQPGKFSLGRPAEGVYGTLLRNREAVYNMGRVLAELTIPSLLPPRGWIVGDKLPHNNQSIGAQCVNNLAASLLYMAFPPNQPVIKYEPIEAMLQPEIDANPDLWGQLELSLSRLAEAHRQRMMTTTLQSAYDRMLKLLIVGGNCLWKQLSVDNPTVHDVRCYVCQRDTEGNPLLSIHEEEVSLASLDEDLRDIIVGQSPELRGRDLWETNVKIFSVCRLRTAKAQHHDDYGNPDRYWEFWQEYKGRLLPGTEVEVDFDFPPMIPLWMIPVYGQNWGLPYCEEYQGDLFAAEVQSSATNDGAAMAALSLLFVDPAGRTSLKQVQQARNLMAFSGKASDVTVFRAEKNADFSFVLQVMERVEKRLKASFLLDFMLQRDGERVTAEEIRRLSGALDKAMGGLYTELAQRTQRPILLRQMALNEAENPKLPVMPSKAVRIQVITGVDALGNSKEVQDLEDLAAFVDKAFPQMAQTILDGPGITTRYAAAKGIKPDGIIHTQSDIDAQQQQQQGQAMRQSLVDKGTSPAVGGLMGALQNMQQAAQQGQPQGLPQQGVPQPPQGAPPPPQPQGGA